MELVISAYRYGFQNQEKDDEIKGTGNSLNYKYRMHDPRLGRFFAVDPLAPHYPHNSPYAFSENTVISHVELEGLESYRATNGEVFATVAGPNSGETRETGYSFAEGTDIVNNSGNYEELLEAGSNPTVITKYEMNFTKGYTTFGEGVTQAKADNLQETGKEYILDGGGRDLLEFKINYQAGSPWSKYNATEYLYGENDAATFVMMGSLSFKIAALNGKSPWDEQNMASWNNLLNGFQLMPIGGFGTGLLRSSSKVAKGSLPTQVHHFATNKNSVWTPRMKSITDKFGLDLDGAWNKKPMLHQGRHPNNYHNFVYEQMKRAAAGAGGSPGKFIQLYNKYVVKPVMDNPQLLRKAGWE